MVDANRDRGFFKNVSHLRNELLANDVLLLAWEDRYETRGRALAEELYLILEEDVTPGYRVKILLPLILAEAVSGNLDKSRGLVEDLITTSREAIPVFEIYGRLIRVYIATLDHDMQTVDQDLAFALQHMQRHDFHHARGLSPRELLPVLQTAVQRSIYPEYARWIAARHLRVGLENDGTAIPLLQITTLGTFEIGMNGRYIAGASDLTLILRQLLGLLISRPRLEIGQEQAQTILWPDVSPLKARNRFDALLSRVRKSLKKMLPELAVTRYVVLEKGVLALRNCSVDATLFSDHLQQGLRASREEKWCRTGNAFADALDLWNGPYAADMLPGEDSSDYAWTLQQQLTWLGLTWCPFLAANGQLDKAVHVAAMVWQENPADEQLTSQLYNLHLQNNETVQATNLCRRYEELLLQQEYPADEIEELLERITEPVA
jgi:DNA-binding SARP family transcriptional activator